MKKRISSFVHAAKNLRMPRWRAKKLVRQLLSIVLIISILAPVLQSTGLASFAEGDWVETGTNVNIAYHATTLNYMKMNGTVRSMRYTYFNFLNKDGKKEEHPVYCLAPEARGAFELVRDDGTTGDAPGTAKYVTGEQCTRADYISIMEAGYPHNTAASIGVNSDEEAYYATKMALWMIILKITPGSGGVGLNTSHPDQAAAQRVYNAAIAIYNKAQANIWAGVKDPEVVFIAPTAADSWHLTGDDQWYEMTITVRSNKWIGTDPNEAGDVQLSWDTSTGELPAGTVVLNGSDDITATMKPLAKNHKQTAAGRVQEITIRVPATTVDEYFEADEDATVFPMPTLIALAEDMGASNFYVAAYTGGGGQPYLIEGDRKIDVSDSYQTVIPKEPTDLVVDYDMGIRVVKLESGTLIPLSGSVFEFYNPRGQFIGSYATDANGEINIPLGEAGTYTIKETVPPQYHILPTHTSESVQVNIGEVTTVTVTNDPYGTLRVEKRDAANGRQLGGTAVQIKHIESGVTHSAITDASGVAEFSNLPIGGYEIREITAPTGYVLDSTVHTVAVKPQTQGITSYTLTNLAKPGLRIIKLDRATSTSIEGVVYEVWHDGLLYGEYVTNVAGEILLTDIPAGTYTVREKSTVDDYVLDPTAQWVEISAGQGIVELVFLNDQKPGIYLIKLDSVTMNGLPNAKYLIKHIGGSFAEEYTTDENGEINLTALEPGTYTVQEIAAPSGYLIDDAIRTIQVNGGENARFVFTNTPKPSLELVKYDPIEDKYLGGATFRIAKIEDGSHYLDRITDTGGRIRIDDLEPGIYSVKEIAAPSGYVLNGREYHVELFPGKTSQIVVENLKKPSFELVKYDPIEDKYLGGATFRIAKIADGSHYLDRITDPGGRIRIDDLEPGIYSVKEIAAPSGYVLNTAEYHVELFPGKTSQIVVENLKKPSLIVWKYDEQTAKTLPDTEFSIAKKGGSIIHEGVTNGDGYIRLDNLDEGWYTITELAPPPGYLPGAVSSKDVYLEAGKTVEIKFDNLRCPTLTVLKLDSITNDPIKNVPFNVKFSPEVNFTGGVVDLGNYYTDENGRILLDNNLKAGWYRVTELEPAAGYIMKEPVTQDIFLRGGEDKTLTFENIPRSALIIHKDDGTSPVQGATFEVRYLGGTSGSGGTLIKTAITSANGTITLTGLAPGTYVIEETRPAPGYQLSNPSVQTAYITDSEQCVVELHFTNPKMGRLVLEKFSSASDHLPIEGVTFRVAFSSGAVVGPNNGEYTTDAAGKVVIDEYLPIGETIIVTEIRCPDEYIMDAPPQTVKIKENTTHVLTFYNSPKSSAQIIKIDAATKAGLKGALFTLYKMNGAIVGTYETNGDGIIILPYLEPGWYKAAETKAPDGYVLDDTPQDFEITSNQFVKLVFENHALACIIIFKTDAKTGKPLEGVTFEVKKPCGEQLGIFTTDKSGRIYISGIPAGKYIVTETKAQDGYELDTTAREVTVTDGKQAVLEVSNTPLAGLRLYKSDSITKLPIFGVEFMAFDSNNKVVGTYYTDNNGLIDFTGILPEGRYTLRETRPADGYYRDDMPRTVELVSGKITEIRWENVPLQGQIQITKKSGDDNEVNGLAAGSPLSDAIFEAYDYRTGNLVDRFMSGKDGRAVSKPLPLGRYIVKEVQAPQWYRLSADTLDIEIEFATQIVKREFINYSANTGVTIRKTGNVEAQPGDEIRYIIKEVRNDSTVQLTDFYWRDTLPTDATRLTKIVTGTYNQSLKYKIIATTNKGDTITVADNLSTTKNNVVDCRGLALGLRNDEYITSFTLIFGTVKAGFTCVEQPQIYVRVLDTLPGGYEFVNKCDVGGKYGAEWVVGKSTWLTTVFGKAVKLPKTGY